MKEEKIAIVKAYSVGNPESVVVVIPKQLSVRTHVNPKGQRFLVKLDGRNRIIYEPIEPIKIKR